MNIKETSEYVQYLEQKYDLLRYQIDGWCVWPLLRFQVIRSLTGLQNKFTDKQAWTKKDRLVFALKDIPKLLSLSKVDFVIQTYSSAHSEYHESKYKDVFFDDILLITNATYSKFELLNNKTFQKNREIALIPSDITVEAINLLGNILRRLAPPSGALDIAEKLHLQLNEELCIETLSTQNIAAIISHFYWTKRIYASLFRRLKPKYLLIADRSYQSIVAAAKENKIKVVEFQHGVVFSYDPGHSWTNYALSYKKKMTVPDKMFLYGEYWREQLALNGFWQDELCVVGNLRVDYYRSRRKELRVRRHSETCNIVVTTQGLDINRVIEFMLCLLKLAKGRIKLKCHFKLHPAYENSSELYKTAFQDYEKEVSVVLGNELPSTYELLSFADFHASIYSTCHYEALALGVPTIILPFVGHEVILPLFEKAQAFLPKTPEEMLNIIIEIKNYQIAKDVSDFYFKAGALEEIKRELEL